jgi:Spy/CpxP family protein refolding chaperone
MWAVAKSLLVLLSLAVNGAFVAAWVLHTAPAASPAEETPKVEGECPLRRQLEANDAQWQEIEPRLTAFRAACTGQCREITRLRKELIELIAADKPDLKAIHAKQGQILEGQRKMQELVVEHLLAAKQVLTPKQQGTLFKLIRIQCGCPEQGALLGKDCDVECGIVNPDRSGACAGKTLTQRRPS